jgi:hypothetical protein
MVVREHMGGGGDLGHNYTLKRHALSDLFPPTRFHLLKFPPLFNSPLNSESINGLSH